LHLLKPKSPAVFTFAFLALFIPASSLLASEIPGVSWRDLSDTDLSPEGKSALSFHGDLWKHAETEHFVYHFIDEKDAKTVYEHAEAYYQWIKNFLGVERDPWKKKSHIFVFSDKPAWQKFNQRVRGGFFEAGGFTNGWELFMFRESFWLAPEKVLAHELTHIILFRFLEGPIDLSLNEGFAEFVSFRQLAVQFDGDEYRLHVVAHIAKEQFIPLETLLTMRDTPADKVEIFYQESELLVRFMVLNFNKKSFYGFLREISRGEDFKRALRDVYNLEFEDLNEKFEVFAVTYR